MVGLQDVFPKIIMSSSPNVPLLNCFCICCFVGVKAAALMHHSVKEGTEVRPTVEEGPLTEQQLGLRQAEERLYRDYIHRLLKVKKRSSHTRYTVNVWRNSSQLSALWVRPVYICNRWTV